MDAAAGLPVIGFEHVGVAVADIDEALATYARLGFERVSVEDLTGQGIRSHIVEAGGVQVELLEVTDPGSRLGRFLAERGPGLHHLCLRVSSLDDALAHLDAIDGARATDPSTDARGRRVFVHPRATEGVLIGLVEAEERGETDI